MTANQFIPFRPRKLNAYSIALPYTGGKRITPPNQSRRLISGMLSTRSS